MKKVRKPGIVPANPSGPTGPSAAVAAVLEGHGVLMGTSMDDHHLIHKPHKGLGAGDLTGAMHVTDALNFGGNLHGHSSPMVSSIFAGSVWESLVCSCFFLVRLCWRVKSDGLGLVAVDALVLRLLCHCACTGLWWSSGSADRGHHFNGGLNPPLLHMLPQGLSAGCCAVL